MTAAEAFRAAQHTDSWDEYRRLLAVAEAAHLTERAHLFAQHEAQQQEEATQ